MTWEQQTEQLIEKAKAEERAAEQVIEVAQGHLDKARHYRQALESVFERHREWLAAQPPMVPPPIATAETDKTGNVTLELRPARKEAPAKTKRPDHEPRERVPAPDGNPKQYLGTLCKNGHDHRNTGFSLRYHSTGGCIECVRRDANARAERLEGLKPRTAAPQGEAKRAGVECPRCKGQALKQKDEMEGFTELKCTSCGHVIATYGADGQVWEAA